VTDAAADARLPFALSDEEVRLLRASLVRYMLYWQEHYEADGGETHSEQELGEVMTQAGRLLWRLEQETAPPGVTVAPSEFAVAPGTTASAEMLSGRSPDNAPSLPGPGWVTGASGGLVFDPGPGHGFMVYRLVPDGGWVGWSRTDDRTTLAFRGQCTCGWEGPPIAGNLQTGQEDPADRERVYDYWDKYHCPDWEQRHNTP
jgi:hypothetical protein